MQTVRLNDYLEDKKNIKSKKELEKVFSILRAQQVKELEITPYHYVDMLRYTEPYIHLPDMSQLKEFMGIKIKLVRE